MNYYVPIQQNEACKRYAFSRTSSSTSSNTPRYILPNLMRKYALISTAYKFLDVEIVMGFISHLQITIGDNQGNRMFILYATKAFIERRTDIERLMQSTVPLSSIQDLNAEFIKIYDTNNVKLTLNGIYLYMKPTTAFLI
ncbi:PREDICTED: uncharacterized protein LOC108692025 [Atta colombica]|uniref:uncharacterized protein LOC108692025 n=1 Tax=Atta colombica TaxID=520822 RepID=UPI00084BC42E|nr:PREDICTED: uncharacterized protein LOC108692025 [Atta colombica]